MKKIFKITSLKIFILGVLMLIGSCVIVNYSLYIGKITYISGSFIAFGAIAFSIYKDIFSLKFTKNKR